VHLDYLRDRGHALPGDSTLVAAAMGGMLAMLGYAMPPSGGSAGSAGSGYSDDEVLDTVTTLLLVGLRGPAGASAGAGGGRI
jgi:hypothetical protein